MEYIRDNVHGDVKIEESVIADLINTSEFQRLRRIIQLGGGQFVFPGANHTRFSHCIGVYQVIRKFLANEDIKSQINNYDRKTVLIAGLLHDIGHGPFSHTFEKISKAQQHEVYTIDIILGNTQVNSVLKKHLIDPNDVANIINGTHKNTFLNSLVSSQLDADRLDYLLRDSINTGVDYANLDLDWIIRNARCKDKKLVFRKKALYAVENFLLGRFFMFKQIYHHNVSYRFDCTFKSWYMRLKDLYLQNYNFKNNEVVEVFKDFFDDKVCNLETYLRLDDYSMIEFMKKTSEEDDEVLRDFSDRMINRRFLAVSTNIEQEKLNSWKNNVKKEYQKYYFDKIDKITLTIYSKDEEKKKIYFIKEDGSLVEMSEISEILREVTTNIEKNLFVFVNDNVQ
ncbi:HD domain-containing protein [Spiroplasma tabanidicola]|uniref:HD superfamily phosphohydrolase n=1 Tax=Spiroplasma tabanidicola TaxID=324079 RepID=A0A6I6CBT6_9MOLU|nr:HD domain-containing protein [Spiroplasma tabanidicola]QGS52435.1 HD superfamily phosphohydrolase [Spiroplasma tabanidicola]